MRRARTLLIGLAGCAILGVLALWQVPQWLDWTRYRSTIEVLASATLGQPVTIQGPISLTLLPQPILTAAQVNVGGGDPDGVSIHLDALRLRVAMWPLIGGRVDARELVLRGPDLRIPWLAEPGVLQTRPPAWLAGFAARIERGRLTIGRLAFTGIDATLATLDTGTLSAAGTARFSGQDWHFTARLTAAGADGTAGLNVTLDGRGRAVGLGANFSGQLAADGTLSGTIASRGPDLAVLLPAPGGPFRADGRLTVGGGLVAADDLVLEVGGSPARGAVALRVSPRARLDVAIAASRLDLDGWLPVLLRAGNTIAGQSLPIGIDLSAEAAQFGGGTLQHLRAAFELAGNGLLVREARALLPGDAALQLSGHVAGNGSVRPRFDADVRLNAPVLRSTLRWLREAAPGLLPAGFPGRLPTGVLQRAELTAHMTMSAEEIGLSRLNGSVDGAAVSGELGLRHGKPASIKADLAMDRLSLDGWLPAQPTGPLSGYLQEGLTELAGLAAGGDGELRFDIRHAVLAGTAISDVSLDAAMEGGSFMLRRLEGSAEGVHLLASGVVGQSGRVSEGRLSLATADATPLTMWVPAPWHATPALWHGPASIDIQAAGPPEALSLGIGLAMADARLDVHPTVDLRSGEWKATLTLRHPGVRRFVATLGLPDRLGLPGLLDWLGDGSLALVAHLSGAPGRLTAESFDLNAGSVRAGGQLALDQGGAEPRLTGRVNADTLSLPLPSAESDVPLPRGMLHGWQADLRVRAGQLLADDRPMLRDAAAAVTLAGGVLRIERFSATLGGGQVAGTCTYDASTSPPTLTAQARLADATITGALGALPIDLLSGRASGSLRIDASGYSPATILATLAGQMQVGVTDGVLSGFDLSRVKAAAALPNQAAAQSGAIDAMASGSTGFDRLDVAASFAHGDLLLDSVRLSGSAGEARVTGGMNLASKAIDVRIALSPAVPDPPEIAVRLSGPLDHPNRTPELANMARWFAERPH